jgi:hypothetical protein
MVLRFAALASAVLLLAPLAQAQTGEQYTYRCTGKDKKKYYGQTIPQACLGQPLELINKQGLVVKRIDHEGDEKARLAKEEQAEKRRELEASQKDAVRRNRALLATYSSEKDIEEARARDLREHQKQVQEVELRIDDIKKRQVRFRQELAVYTNDASKGKPPPRLQEEITNADIDLKAQQGLLEAKKKDALAINARYDEDRRRYVEATGGDPAARAKALGMEKGVTVKGKAAPTTESLREQRDAHRRAADDRAELQRVEREREDARRRQQYEIDQREAQQRREAARR